MKLSKKVNTRYLVYTILGIFLFILGLMFSRYIEGKGLTALIQFDTIHAENKLPILDSIPHHVRDPSGYDGQFYAQIAIDPTLKDPSLEKALDWPNYRARRIFVPLVGYCLGLGNPTYIIYIFPFINLLFWIILACLAFNYAKREACNFQGILCVIAICLSTGCVESIRLSLTDLPFATLAIAGVFALHHQRTILSYVCFALSCLTRFTGIIGVAATYFPENMSIRSLTAYALKGALIFSPFALWFVYLNSQFPGTSQGIHGNLTYPFISSYERLLRSFSVLQTRLSPQEIFTIFAIIGLHVQFIFYLVHRKFKNAIWRLGFVYSILMLCLGPSVWAVHMAVCRVILPMTLCFNFLLMTQKTNRFCLWFLLGNFYSLYGVIKFIVYKS